MPSYMQPKSRILRTRSVGPADMHPRSVVRRSTVGISGKGPLKKRKSEVTAFDFLMALEKDSSWISTKTESTLKKTEFT
eukprot:TRINITY_DN5030_c0_g1_i1.p2 TRINITY_DN5030_c0_g1~~TRINITY_DN5030_c0_g1_i1.p2  ORF type:complete len:79 (-),score=8.93 TRINITY_DN5030_c0_g1_i1:191-427(-)